jgi:hypothetical protein
MQLNLSSIITSESARTESGQAFGKANHVFFSENFAKNTWSID